MTHCATCQHWAVYMGFIQLYCLTLTKGSNWQVTQNWERDVLDWTWHILHILPLQVWNRNTQPSERYLSQDTMIWHWYQCMWHTHFAHLREMSFSRVASFCQSTAVYISHMILGQASPWRVSPWYGGYQDNWGDFHANLREGRHKIQSYPERKWILISTMLVSPPGSWALLQCQNLGIDRVGLLRLECD